MRIEGNTDECFGRCEDDVLDLELAASFKDVVRAHSVGTELSGAVGLSRGGDGGQVDDGIDAAVRHVLKLSGTTGNNRSGEGAYSCQECLNDSSHILEVNLYETVCTTETRLAVLTDTRRATSVN